MTDIQKPKEQSVDASSSELTGPPLPHYFLRNGEGLRKITLADSPLRVVRDHFIDSIGADWKLNTGYENSIFGHNQKNQEILFFHEDNLGNYKRGDTIGRIGTEWQLFLVGVMHYSLIFGHNRSTDPNHPEYQGVKVWVVSYSTNLKEVKLGKIGTEWDLQPAYFNGSLTLLGVKNKTADIPGQLGVWYVGVDSDQIPTGITYHTIVGQIGTEWRLQVTEINNDGYADIIGYSANGDLRVWYALHDDDGRLRAFDDARDYGTLGAGWQRLDATYFNNTRTIFGQSSSGAVHGWYIFGERIFSDLDLSPHHLDPEWKLVPGWRQYFVV